MTQGRRRTKAASAPKSELSGKAQKVKPDVSEIEPIQGQVSASHIQPDLVKKNVNLLVQVKKNVNLLVQVKNHTLHHRFEPSTNTRLLANQVTEIECKSLIQKQQVLSNIRQLNELKSNEALEVLND